MDYVISTPSQPRVIMEEGNKGIYQIDALYAGYGHTLGNSLRRIILSSIPGAAVTSVKIDGVPHEFSKIPGIKEDVINILLHLKRVRFKMHTDEPQTAKISARGVKDIKAKDIQTSSQMEVLNKDEHIASLTSKDSKLDIELTVEKGLGYVSRDRLHKDKVDVGIIVLDAVFTPIKRVNYEVENMRVGDRTDYNSLHFIIETDGSISPSEALQKSIEIMISHLKAIVGFQEESEVEGMELEKEMEEKDESAEKTRKQEEAEILKIRVEDLQFSSRTQNALAEAGIRTVGGLARKKEADLLKMEGVGKKAILEIRRALGNYGLILK